VVEVAREDRAAALPKRRGGRVQHVDVAHHLLETRQFERGGVELRVSMTLHSTKQSTRKEKRRAMVPDPNALLSTTD
jgi:hypothetical protein